MKDTDSSFKEKLNDTIGDIQCRIQLLTERRYFAPVFAVSAILLVVILAVIAASTITKPAPPEFTYPAATGFEDKEFTMKEGKITVRLRISDIKSIDKKDRNKEYQTSTVFAEKTDTKRIIADLLITNNSGKDITIGSLDGCNIVMGHTLNNSDKHAKDDILCCGIIYNRAEKKRDLQGTVTLPNKETTEISLSFDYTAGDINLINTLIICGEYYEGAGEKYEIAGVGKPIVIFRFKNDTLFPIMRVGEEELIDPEESEAPAQTLAYNGRFGWSKLDEDSKILRSFNNDNSDSFALSLDIAAEGSVSSNVTVAESGYSNTIDNSYIVGKIPEITYTEGKDFDRIKLYFKVTEKLKKNTLGTYVSVSDEFKGIRRLNVFMYDEEINMLLPIETNFDEERGIVWAESDRAGTYCLVDMELWLDNLGISPQEYEK